jgi:hypothetical protein
MRTTGQPAIQGYNAQAAVNESQITVAAAVTVDAPDFGHLEPGTSNRWRTSSAAASRR